MLYKITVCDGWTAPIYVETLERVAAYRKDYKSKGVKISVSKVKHPLA